MTSTLPYSCLCRASVVPIVVLMVLSITSKWLPEAVYANERLCLILLFSLSLSQSSLFTLGLRCLTSVPLCRISCSVYGSSGFSASFWISLRIPCAVCTSILWLCRLCRIRNQAISVLWVLFYPSVYLCLQRFPTTTFTDFSQCVVTTADETACKTSRDKPRTFPRSPTWFTH